MTPAVRFWSKVDRSGGNGLCWPWLGQRDKDGYGMFYPRHGVCVRAHRFSLATATTGVMPPQSVVVRHTCDNPPCVNPRHLVAGSTLENVRDRDAKGRNGCARKTHCKRGHAFTPENTYRNGRGDRICRACRAVREGRPMPALPSATAEIIVEPEEVKE